MAKIMAIIRVMPESVEVDLDKLEELAKNEIIDFGGDVVKTSKVPIAFGLNALDVEFFLDESKGSLDPLEEKLVDVEGVTSATTTSVRRTVG